VIGADGEAIFVLDCPDGPPALRESYGFNRHTVSQIKMELANNIALLCEYWSKIHGR
jgi:hypothetical protein